MRIFDESKRHEITDYDLNLGSINEDTLVIHHDAVEHVDEVGHYVTIAEYPNGGKEVEWVVDVEGAEGKEAYDEEEQILVYIPYTPEQLEEKELGKLRSRRESECFSIVNRGEPWYRRLTEEQKLELDSWYAAWLDVTETKVIPEKPGWLANEVTA